MCLDTSEQLQWEDTGCHADSPQQTEAVHVLRVVNHIAHICVKQVGSFHSNLNLKVLVLLGASVDRSGRRRNKDYHETQIHYYPRSYWGCGMLSKLSFRLILSVHRLLK